MAPRGDTSPDVFREIPAIDNRPRPGEAGAGVQALALRVIAERLENREEPAEFLNVTFQAA